MERNEQLQEAIRLGFQKVAQNDQGGGIMQQLQGYMDAAGDEVYDRASELGEAAEKAHKMVGNAVEPYIEQGGSQIAALGNMLAGREPREETESELESTQEAYDRLQDYIKERSKNRSGTAGGASNQSGNTGMPVSEDVVNQYAEGDTGNLPEGVSNQSGNTGMDIDPEIVQQLVQSGDEISDYF